MWSKRKWPAVKVLSREQIFTSSEYFPDGYVLERLECGHDHRVDVSKPYPLGAGIRRRCGECARILKVRNR